MFDLMETKPWIIFGCHISRFLVMIQDCLPPKVLDCVFVVTTPKLNMSAPIDMYSGGMYPVF